MAKFELPILQIETRVKVYILKYISRRCERMKTGLNVILFSKSTSILTLNEDAVTAAWIS